MQHPKGSTPKHQVRSTPGSPIPPLSSRSRTPTRVLLCHLIPPSSPLPDGETEARCSRFPPTPMPHGGCPGAPSSGRGAQVAAPGGELFNAVLGDPGTGTAVWGRAGGAHARNGWFDLRGARGKSCWPQTHPKGQPAKPTSPRGCPTSTQGCPKSATAPRHHQEPVPFVDPTQNLPCALLQPNSELLGGPNAASPPPPWSTLTFSISLGFLRPPCPRGLGFTWRLIGVKVTRKDFQRGAWAQGGAGRVGNVGFIPILEREGAG